MTCAVEDLPLEFAATGSDAAFSHSGSHRGSYTSDNWIHRLYFFRKCDPKFISEVARSFTIEVFRPGQVLVREGVQSSSLVVINRGEVEVLEKGRPVRHLDDGECFGEAHLLGVRRQTVESVRARTFVDTRILSREALAQVLSHNPYERLLFSHIAITMKLEIFGNGWLSSAEGSISENKLRQMEEQLRRLEQVLSRGRKSAVAALSRDSATKADLLSFDIDAPSSDGESQAIKPRYVKVEEQLPGCWQSLADWHRQLAASPEGRRLNLWQLEYYRAPGTRASASRCSRYSSTSDGSRTCRTLGTGSTGSRRESNSALAGSTREASPRQPPRPHSVASTVRAQPPYPRLPPTTQRDPACLHNTCRKSIPPFSARSCRRRPPVANKAAESPGRPGDPHWWSVSGDDNSRAGVGSRELVKQPNQALPPGLGEAIAELSRCLLRSQWHCENLARERSRSVSASRARSGSASPAQDSISPPESTSPPERRRHGERSVEFCENEHSAATSVVGLSLPPLDMRPTPLSPARRLEVTLRGTFRTEDGPDGGAEGAADGPGICIDDCEQEADGNTAPRATSVMLCSKEEDAARARMGFGRDEVGGTPSGRTSVPAVRHSSSGALSAPLPHGAASGVDEGIDLASLEQCVEHHVRRILERGLHAPSRAASCEPQEPMSLSPLPGCFSPPASLCPSPSPDRAREELTVSVRVRLCQTRCGSSSAVLALSLDHGPDCNEACGCRCWPSPEDSEARLLAFFARRSWLRLTASQRPVRVLLEPLADADEEAQSMSISFSATTASAMEESWGSTA